MATQTDRLPIGIDDVHAAAERLRGVAHRTPVLTSRTLDERCGGRVFLKAENLQRIGAFKFRGAYNAVTALAPERGVATASSGNHAQAVALSAALHGLQATILMPQDAPPAKRAATEGYGAEVLEFDRYADDRDAMAHELCRERGLTLVHPYDEPLVMAGQGTAGLELLEDVPDLDLVVVPVGGGGLISGVATAVKAERPRARVIGVEPEASPDTQRSLRAGRRERVEIERSIADGQLLPEPGERTFAVISALVDDVVTVADEEIVEAMRFLFERMKIVVEPSGASALAALVAGARGARRRARRRRALGRQRRRRAVRRSLSRPKERSPARRRACERLAVGVLGRRRVADDEPLRSSGAGGTERTERPTASARAAARARDRRPPRSPPAGGRARRAGRPRCRALGRRSAGRERRDQRVAPAPVALAHARGRGGPSAPDRIARRGRAGRARRRGAVQRACLDDRVDQPRRQHEPAEPQPGRERLARRAGVDDVLGRERLERADRLRS